LTITILGRLRKKISLFIGRIFVYKNEGKDENEVFIAENWAKIFSSKISFSNVSILKHLTKLKIH